MSKFLKAVLNIFFLNIVFFYNNIILKKKTILFYHENFKLIKIHNYYVEKLLNLNKKKFFVIYLHADQKLKLNNYYFLINYFCELIFCVDLFISNNVCDYFTRKSKKIYIHHDIMDTPLVNDREKSNLKKRLLAYDYICVSSKNSSKIFDDLLTGEKNTKIIPIGYFKLDYLLSKKLRKNTSNKIIIAPTNYKSFKNMTILNDLDYLISFILKKTSFSIIFRPHPSNFKDKTILNLKMKYINNKRFFFDQSKNYHKVYMSSFCMITDISGTAYTYAFLTKNPVAFYCSYKKKVEDKYAKLFYFKNREEIGIVIRGKKNLIKLKNIKKNIKFYKNKINILMKENLIIGRTKENFINLINKI